MSDYMGHEAASVMLKEKLNVAVLRNEDMWAVGTRGAYDQSLKELIIARENYSKIRFTIEHADFVTPRGVTNNVSIVQ